MGEEWLTTVVGKVVDTSNVDIDMSSIAWMPRYLPRCEILNDRRLLCTDATPASLAKLDCCPIIANSDRKRKVIVFQLRQMLERYVTSAVTVCSNDLLIIDDRPSLDARACSCTICQLT